MSKASVLSSLAPEFAVPPFLAFGALRLAPMWESGPQAVDQLNAQLATVRSTAGAFLDRHVESVQQLLEQIRWTPWAAHELQKHLEEAGLNLADGMAVRSSGGGEDSESGSFAGMLHTELDVDTIEALQRAILRVWKSGFDRSVIIEKLRTNTLGREDAGEMVVIVQRMVKSVMSGVAFSHSPADKTQVLVEAVEGLGTSYVGGERVDYSLAVARDAIGQSSLPVAGPGGGSLVEAGRLAVKISDLWGRPVDVEWAYDGDRVWLLQARADNSVPVDSVVSEAMNYRSCDLYLGPEADLAFFRPLPEFASYFRIKRRPLMLCGEQAGAHMGVAMLIRSNAEGIDKLATDPRFLSIRSDRVIVDVSDGLRQMTLERSRVTQFLGDLLTPAPQTFVVREFIQGEGGLISFELESASHEVACEYSEEGLLALNRGTARSATYGLEDIGSLMPSEERERLRQVTQQATRSFGPVQLEWVLSQQRLTLVDYSRIGTVPVWSGGNRRTISRGPIIGVAMRIEDALDLHEMSVAAAVSLDDIPAPEHLGGSIRAAVDAVTRQTGPTIVLVSKPYAVLAALLPHVSGFIFENSSMLCHLAILLRERGVPAIADDALFLSTREGELLYIEN